MTESDYWTEPQRILVDRIMWARGVAHEWPVYQWVEAEMWERGHRALDVIASFPVQGGPHARGRTYCDIRVQRAGIPNPEERVRLTVRGLSRHPLGRQLAELFVRTLRLAAQRRAQATFEPTRVVEVRLADKDVAAQAPDSASLGLIRALPELMEGEPLWGEGIDGRQGQPDGSWSVDIGPAATQFADMTLDKYVAWIDTLLAPQPSAPTERRPPSPLDVATWLTYLDTTWKLHQKHGLVLVEDHAGLTSLTVGVATAEEYKARCAVIGDVLKSLQAPSVPGVDGHALQRLKAYLEARLEPEDRSELDDAMENLRRVRQARDAGTHSSAAGKGQLALAELGIAGPPYEWSTAWEAIRSATVNALMDLRAVVARLPRR